jgi:hypothetical protein
MVKTAQTPSLPLWQSPPLLGGGGTAMKYASVCPICLQALQIHTSEPHPIRDGVDILTYRCEKCGPIKSRLFVHRVPRDKETVFRDVPHL